MRSLSEPNVSACKLDAKQTYWCSLKLPLREVRPLLDLAYESGGHQTELVLGL